MAGLYFHIPFCNRKCSYCNFFSVASRKLIPGFLPAMLKEIRTKSSLLAGQQIESVYFGGGTPSLLPAADIYKLLNASAASFSLQPDCEITLEANPGDLDKIKTAAYKNMGINRISLGIQSFHEQDLRYLQRDHTPGSAFQSLETCIAQGFDNISVDLIYGIPGQGMDRWQENLDLVASRRIPHLSAYWLTVEEKTPLRWLLDKGRLPAPEEEDGIGHFQLLNTWAGMHGYEHYEISNFAAHGRYSRHNLGYWTGSHYLGFGPSAHSYNGSKRWWNPGTVTGYIASVDHGTPAAEEEFLDNRMKFEEMLLTGLRTQWGVNLQKVRDGFGGQCLADLLLKAAPYFGKGWLKVENDCLKVTSAGMLRLDGITAALFPE